MKAYKIIALLLGVLLCAAMLAACNKQPAPPALSAPCAEHADADGNGICDVCSTLLTTVPPACETHTDKNNDKICDVCKKKMPIVKIDYTITLKDEQGNPMEGIEIMLKLEDEEVDFGTTDANGQIKSKIEAGRYQLIIGELPEYWYSSDNYSMITVSSTSNSFSLTAVDNSPNGSPQKPYPAENAETGVAASLSFAVGDSFYFVTKGESRFLLIHNAQAKVIYNGQEYTPVEGVIRVLLDASDVNANTMFCVENTADSENLITLGFEAIPGSLGNPFAAELGVQHTVSVVAGTTVYYELVAASEGYLTIEIVSQTNNIILYNTTKTIVSAATDGATTATVFVSEGDTVRIAVSTLLDAPTEGEAPVDEISFVLSIPQGTQAGGSPIHE